MIPHMTITINNVLSVIHYFTRLSWLPLNGWLTLSGRLAIFDRSMKYDSALHYLLIDRGRGIVNHVFFWWYYMTYVWRGMLSGLSCLMTSIAAAYINSQEILISINCTEFQWPLQYYTFSVKVSLEDFGMSNCITAVTRQNTFMICVKQVDITKLHVIADVLKVIKISCSWSRKLLDSVSYRLIAYQPT